MLICCPWCMLLVYVFVIIIVEGGLNASVNRILPDSVKSFGSKTFKPCNHGINSHLEEQRRLFIITCESRKGLNSSIEEWRTTGLQLSRSKGVFMWNICENIRWKGYFTKPLVYLSKLLEISKDFEQKELNHVMIMDSDTMWSATNVSDIWRNYDCARGDKNALVSSEMICWVGSVCSTKKLSKYYDLPANYSSHSPFVNSGVIMGQLDVIERMLRYTIANNASYMRMWSSGPAYSDQFAVTDYVKLVAPNEIAIDYHQQLTGSFIAAAPFGTKHDAVCYNRDGSIAKNCHSFLPDLINSGGFIVDNVTCALSRRMWHGMPIQEELESLNPTPSIWHGNGRGKGAYVYYSEKVLLCLKSKTKKEKKVLNWW